MKFFSRKQTKAPQQQQVSLDGKDLIKWLLSEHVKPLLKQEGFAKSGMTFYRTRDDIVDVINFQGSKWNGFGNHTFFINCGMDSLDFQLKTTGQQNFKPFYSAPLYSDRIGSMISAVPEYVMSENYKTPDLEKFANSLVEQLKELLEFYSKSTSVDHLLDLAIKRNGLRNYEEICYYLAQTHDKKRLTQFVQDLSARFSGKDDRWLLFADAIHAVIGEYANDKIIAKLLEGHHLPTYEPKRFQPPNNKSTTTPN